MPPGEPGQHAPGRGSRKGPSGPSGLAVSPQRAVAARRLHPCRCTRSRVPCPSSRRRSSIAAFDGWVDAGSAATTVLELLGEGGTVVARFDPDQLFDYRSRRPTLTIRNGRLDSLDWPEVTLRAARHGGRDLLVLTGAEPDDRWHRLAADTVELLGRLGVAGWISLGAIPAAVAHTRPVPILGTASRDGLLRGGVLPGAGRAAPGPVGGAVDARDRGRGVRRARGRLLRADPALRERPVRARRARAAARAGAAPRRHAAARRPRGGGPPAPASGWTPRPRPTRRPAPTWSAWSRWSTRPASPPATT